MTVPPLTILERLEAERLTEDNGFGLAQEEEAGSPSPERAGDWPDHVERTSSEAQVGGRPDISSSPGWPEALIAVIAARMLALSALDAEGSRAAIRARAVRLHRVAAGKILKSTDTPGSVAKDGSRCKYRTVERMRKMVSRKARFSLLAAPALLMLAACAGADAPDDAAAAGAIAGYAAAPQWPGSPFPSLSYEDRDALGRVSYAEAGNQGEEGIAAVIFTILNRVNSGHFDSTVQDVIDAPNQFEPATRAGGWRYLRPLDPWQTVQFDTILNLILAGRLPDLTNGALFFQNAEIVAARAARGRVSSSLVDFGGTPPVAEIGDHRFYDWRAGINLGARRQRRVVPETYAVYGEPDGSSDAYAGASPEAAEVAAPEPAAEAVTEAPQVEVAPESDIAYALPAEGDCTLGASC